jgi:hypothetical protein
MMILLISRNARGVPKRARGGSGESHEEVKA